MSQVESKAFQVVLFVLVNGATQVPCSLLVSNAKYFAHGFQKLNLPFRSACLLQFALQRAAYARLPAVR